MVHLLWVWWYEKVSGGASAAVWWWQVCRFVRAVCVWVVLCMSTDCPELACFSLWSTTHSWVTVVQFPSKLYSDSSKIDGENSQSMQCPLAFIRRLYGVNGDTYTYVYTVAAQRNSGGFNCLRVWLLTDSVLCCLKDSSELPACFKGIIILKWRQQAMNIIKDDHEFHYKVVPMYTQKLVAWGDVGSDLSHDSEGDFHFQLLCWRWQLGSDHVTWGVEKVTWSATPVPTLRNWAEAVMWKVGVGVCDHR